MISLSAKAHGAPPQVVIPQRRQSFLFVSSRTPLDSRGPCAAYGNLRRVFPNQRRSWMAKETPAAKADDGGTTENRFVWRDKRAGVFLIRALDIPARRAILVRASAWAAPLSHVLYSSAASAVSWEILQPDGSRPSPIATRALPNPALNRSGARFGIPGVLALANPGFGLN